MAAAAAAAEAKAIEQLPLDELASLPCDLKGRKTHSATLCEPPPQDRDLVDKRPRSFLLLSINFRYGSL